VRRREGIVQSTRVENAGIDCVLHLQRDILNDEMKCAMVYKLNGKKRQVDCTIRSRFSENTDAKLLRAFGEMRTALAENIAAELLGAAFDQAARRNFEGFL
jgi:hypothetical protein